MQDLAEGHSGFCLVADLRAADHLMSSPKPPRLRHPCLSIDQRWDSRSEVGSKQIK